MVRHTEADDEATFEPITSADDISVGDTVDIHGQSFLPKSNMEVVNVDPDWADTDGTVFETKIPGRSNAREYSFRILNGWIETTDSAGRWGSAVDASVKVEADDEDDADVEAAEGDTVTIRTDDGLIHATVDDVVDDRPDDGARLGGTLDVDDPSVHYVDYHHADE